MALLLENKRKKLDNIQKEHPQALILDVTSKGPLPWVKFSPFYPHGNIPVPFSPGHTAKSVEGIWQGLKVFASAGVDTTYFAITTMKNIKRTGRRFGQILGHRQGVHGQTLLPYREARYQIYLPIYKWVLDHCLQTEVAELKQMMQQQQVILLDYETNRDVENLTKPLSHAGLLISYLEEKWPSATGEFRQ
jgi:hypothetical protein